MPHPKSRDARAFADAARHSRRVRLLKYGLPALALFGIAAFAGAAMMTDLPELADNIEIGTGSMTLSDGKIVMASPKLDGYTNDNRPYEMRAERAIQEVGNTEMIELETITATLPFEGEAVASVAAERGVFNNTTQELVFDRPLTVTTSNGMQATLQDARVNLKDGALATEQPVEIEMDGSRITADSMRVEERGKVLVFENRVRLSIDPQRLQAAAKDREEAAAE